MIGVVNQRRQNEIYYIEKEAYLFCLHVRPTTIFCGLIILIMSFMNIIILLSKFSIDFNPQEEKEITNNHTNLDPRFKTNKLIILFIIAESLKLLISILLIYGVTRCKPSYLIPFFLMQLFYFFRSVSFFLESYANYQNNSVYRNEFFDTTQKNRNEVPNSYPLLIFFFSLLYKLYFICVIFRCYKYLKMKEALQLNQTIQFRHYQQPITNATISVLHQQTNPPSYTDCIMSNVGVLKEDYDNEQKLPSYDEACKIEIKNEEIAPVTTSLSDTNSTTVTITNTTAENSNNKSLNTQV